LPAGRHPCRPLHLSDRHGTFLGFIGSQTYEPMEIAMKIRLSHTLAGLVLVAGTSLAAADTIIVTPEQQTVIREYVVKQHVEPVAPPADFELSVGSTLPDTIELQPLDVPDIETRYDYVVLDGQTVLVEPGTRRIVQIMD
jgi:Protein of unknown function (DUF1236)